MGTKSHPMVTADLGAHRRRLQVQVQEVLKMNRNIGKQRSMHLSIISYLLNALRITDKSMRWQTLYEFCTVVHTTKHCIRTYRSAYAKQSLCFLSERIFKRFCHILLSSLHNTYF